MTTIVRTVSFSAGHRLWQHESKCAHIHGHNYVVEFHATAEQLDSLGRVIDFSVLRDRLGGWIDEHWDHGFICKQDDHEVLDAMQRIPGQKLFVMEVNPTAENLALHLLRVVGPQQLAGTGVKLTRVVLSETDNCRAEVTV